MQVLLVAAFLGLGWLIYVRVYGAPRWRAPGGSKMLRDIVRVLAFLAGAAAGFGFVLAVAGILHPLPFEATFVALALGPVAGVIVWHRSTNPILRVAATGFIVIASAMWLFSPNAA